MASWDEWVKAGISIRYRPTFSSVWVGADVIAAEDANYRAGWEGDRRLRQSCGY
jgi:hypothetical protein